MASTFAHNSYLNNSTSPPPSLWLKRVTEPKANQNSNQPNFSKLVRGVTKLSKNLNTSIEPQNYALKKALREHVESGCMEVALCVFEKMSNSDTYYWNLMIRGLVDKGLLREAIHLYHRMQREGVQADNYTYPFVIKACGGLSSLSESQKVHGTLFKVGLDSDAYVGNALCAAYGKLGYIEYAEIVFEEMPVKDLVSWNSIISGYVAVGDGWSSLVCFREMQIRGLKPDTFSLIGALNACAIECFLRTGKEIHGQVLKCMLELDIMVQTSLIDMYHKCGRVDYAVGLFDKISTKNVVVWNAMIHGYTLNARPFESLSCLKRMQEVDNMKPDAITMINLLPSCTQIGAPLEGKSIHGYAIRQGFVPHIVLETSLIELYSACGRIKLAECIFRQLAERNLVTWNAMISAHVQCGQNREALRLFLDLLSKRLEPDAITISSILPAYSEAASMGERTQIHGLISKLEHNSNTFISNATVYMYAKCGDLETARGVFDRIIYRDVSSWNTMIMAYAIHGFGAISIELFSKMRDKGLQPNESTFVSLLTACSVSGMVNEGWKYYHSMKLKYGIDPGVEHYGCMIDLLGRTGDLYRAKSFIEEMPLVPTARIWGSLLAASRNNKNIELAELASGHILSSKLDNTGCYVLLSNMFADAGRWEDVERIKSLMKQKGLRKTVGCSFVEAKCRAYRFINYDTSHVETSMIYAVLDLIMSKIEEDRYVASVSKFRPLDLKKKRENSVESHSVRLAICFGLISTEIRNPVVVRKNTRMCEDCHRVAKKVSEMSKREIIVGDCKVFHHFIDGSCSCGDYW